MRKGTERLVQRLFLCYYRRPAAFESLPLRKDRDQLMWWTYLLEGVFFLNALSLMGIVLLQMSEHSGLGGAFGSGASNTVFGRDETRDPKRTTTVVLATVFLVLGFVLMAIG